MEKGEIGKSGDGFIDRSKVRILLCDSDESSSQEVFTLLSKCSYQVTSVKSPRQVIDALNAEGPDIDIILSEIDLPMSKGFKLLKYIMRDKELRRIPVIMMSAQDEVSIVVKCLKFGAADYLVKPLRTNELLNLWTHMWRRRRMLGLAEKNIVSYDIDPVVSDPSDANTNSTTLFSDDTDEKSRKSNNQETCASTYQENETNDTTTAAPIEIASGAPPEHLRDVPGLSNQHTGQISPPFPKRSRLKIGESSAFFTYVKSNTPKSKSPSLQENASQHEKIVHNSSSINGQVGPNISEQDSRDPSVSHSQANDYPRASNSIPDSCSMEFTQTRLSNEEFSQSQHMQSTNNSPNDVSGCYPQNPYHFYMPGVMNQVPMQSAAMVNHANSSRMPQYNHIPPGMASYPYYPFGICLQPGQMGPTHPWPSYGNPSNEGKTTSKVDRREAALMKFRQKRKERCFDKKIRYVNRKKLAERRPRLRGQFVRKVNGVNVDLNGQPASDEEEEEDYDEDDHSNMDFSPDDDASMCQR